MSDAWKLLYTEWGNTLEELDTSESSHIGAGFLSLREVTGVLA